MIFGVKHICLFLCLFMLTSVFTQGMTQDGDSLETLIKEFYAFPSPTGYEYPLIEAIRKKLPGGLHVKQDNLGGLHASASNGSRFVLVTGVDEIGYIVGGIEESGFLTLDRAVASPFPLFDSFFPGHGVTIWTETGPVRGILALPSTHILSREARRHLSDYFRLNNFLVDTGAESREDAEAAGVKYCDPVTPDKHLHNLGGRIWSGYGIGSRCCAVLLLQAVLAVPDDMLLNASFSWLVQTKFYARGSRPAKALGAVHAHEKTESTTILVIAPYPKPADSDSMAGKGLLYTPGSASHLSSRISAAAEAHGISLRKAPEINSPVLNAYMQDYPSSALWLPVKYLHTPSESVFHSDLSALMKIIEELTAK
jgi:putative aminopeptidase FrvX